MSSLTGMVTQSNKIETPGNEAIAFVVVASFPHLQARKRIGGEGVR